MKRLFLLRHAKSSWDDPSLPDRERPLAPRGRQASRLIADHLRRERVAPELVLCSPARRTRETLDRIAPALGGAEVRFDERIYGASGAELLAALRELADPVDSVTLIGHNPGVEELTLSLARPGPETERAKAKFPTAALATLELDGGWAALAPGGAELASFVKPKELAKRGDR